MKLYEVNREIDELLAQLEPDPETGEIPANEGAIIAQLDALTLRKKDILEYLAKVSMESKATIEAMKAEEKRLHERRKQAEKRQEQLITILDRECGGKKTDLGVATLCYMHTKRVEITDKQALLDWLDSTGNQDCYWTPEPEISKTKVGKLLDKGVDVDGAERVQSVSCYLR